MPQLGSHANRVEAAGIVVRRPVGGLRPPYTMDHAGEPHRRRITQGEKRLIREHLEEVNARLRGKGMRTIDPKDSKMKERCGL